MKYWIGVLILALCVWRVIDKQIIEVEPIKPIVDTTRAVIHHTASGDVSAETIDRWHREERGWDMIGYHFVIRKDGTIEEGRPLTKLGAHAKGRNHYVGIALTGNNEFTSEQFVFLLELLLQLGVTHIERHNEECPGYNMPIETIQTILLDN